MRSALGTFAAVAAGLVLVAPAWAHHGTSSYDMGGEPVTLSGTVTEFVWGNPHAFLLFDVTDDKGNLIHWAGEMNSPTVLARAGWSKTVFTPGDQISLSVRPSKAGTPVGLINRSLPIIINGQPLEIEPPQE